MLEFLFFAVRAVSYTHLDVYKRQGQEGEVSTGLLDAVDLGVLRQHLIGLRREGDAGAARYVIEDHRKVHPVGDVLIVLDQSGLAALVVVGGDVEQGVGSGVLGVELSLIHI